MKILNFFKKKQTSLTEFLIGDWQAIKLDDEPIIEHGFTSISMKIGTEQIDINTEMNDFGGISTKSKGKWSITEKGEFKSNFGEVYKISKIEFRNGNIIFIPDPLFSEKGVTKSEYSKIL